MDKYPGERSIPGVIDIRNQVQNSELVIPYPVAIVVTHGAGQGKADKNLAQRLLPALEVGHFTHNLQVGSRC